jgi:hypothetical protein
LVVGVDSESEGFGEAALSMLGEGEGALVKGGGSMPELGVDFAGSTGSGSARISASADDVSTVICFVVCAFCRNV